MAKLITLKLLTLLFVSSAAYAEWTLVETSKSGVRWYVAEAYTLPDETIRAYLKAEGKKFKVQPFALLIDCTNRRVRDYIPGQLGEEFFIPWNPVVPDSRGEVAFKAYCSNGANEKTDASTLSESYLGRLRARIRPNIVFIPVADTDGAKPSIIEIIVAKDGTIKSQKLVTSSGNPSWDTAVQKAIQLTESVPRPVNGRTPEKITLQISPSEY